MKHRKTKFYIERFSNLSKAIKDFLAVKRKQIRGTPKTKKRINGKPIEKYDINISKSKDVEYSYQHIVYLIREVQTGKRRMEEEKRVLAEKKVKNNFIAEQQTDKKRKDKRSQKRKLIPESKRVDNQRERGIVQWITKFESGYRTEIIGTRFLIVLVYKNC